MTLLAAPSTSNITYWEPHPGPQTQVLQRSEDEILFGGARGGGKTEAGLAWLCEPEFASHSKAKGLVVRKNADDLSDWIERARHFYYGIARITGNPPVIRFNNGALVRTGHMKDFKSLLKYQGHEYQKLLIEELTQIPTLDMYLMLLATNRSTIPGLPAQGFFTTNPGNIGHNWVKQRFVDLAYRKTFIDPTSNKSRIFIPSKVYDNPTIMNHDPDYVNFLKSLPPHLRAIWLDGDWNVVAGGMFNDLWRRQHHVLTPFSIPDSWYCNRSFDWGSSKPFSVGWWARSDGTDYVDAVGRVHATVAGDVFRFAEWYGAERDASGVVRANKGLKMLAVDIARGILERELKWGAHGRILVGPADSSIFNSENGMCIAEDMAKAIRIDGRWYPGIQWKPADKRPGSRATGWEMMRKYMKGALPNDDGRPREHPGLFVFSSCDQFIRTVPTLPRDEKKTDDVDTDAEDHVGDESRYEIVDSHSGAYQGSTTGDY